MSSPPLDVVCALIFHNGHILATRRDGSRDFPLLWEFPGGKVEDGEAPEEALHRELEEELRLRVTILKSLDSVSFRADESDLRLLPFLCTPAQEDAPQPVDHPEIRWIRPEAASSLTWAPADVPLVENLAEMVANSVR